MQSFTTLLKWIRAHQHPQMMTVCKCADIDKRVHQCTHSALPSNQIARKDVLGHAHIENICTASFSSETHIRVKMIWHKVKMEQLPKFSSVFIKQQNQSGCEVNSPAQFLPSYCAQGPRFYCWHCLNRQTNKSPPISLLQLPFLACHSDWIRDANCCNCNWQKFDLGQVSCFYLTL